MSGDVQPRKRKDKKRKKDDYGDISAQSQSSGSSSSSTSVSDDVNIHVHKEDGTGGGICAKIVFFLLFTALAVLIGLIITEHRGLTDLDSVDSESKFSQIFEGWIDNSEVAHHDDHLVDSLEEEQDDHDHDEASHELEQHEDEEDEHEEEEEEHDDSDAPDQDEDEEEDEEEEDEMSEEKSQLDDDEEDDIDDDGDDDDEVDQDETNEDQNVSSKERYQEDDDDDDITSNQNDDEDEDDDDNIEEDEEDESSQQQQNDDDEESQDQDQSQEDEIDESRNVLDDDDDDQDKTDDVASEDAEDKSQEQEIEDVEDISPPKPSPIIKTEEVKEKEDEAENEQDYSRMTVKIGVGVALLVVAHVVLVRKWKPAGGPSDSISEKHEPNPDLSRRNTIVVPPTFQEVEQDIEETIESDYSDEDGEVDSEDEMKIAKVKYQELRTTYERSLTPESEVEYQNKLSKGEDEEEYEAEEEEEDGDEEEGEEEEFEDDEEGEFENEPQDEDEELLRRLEAKYGKIKKNATTATSKPDDFDEQLSSWKRVNVRPDNEAEESESDRQSDDPDTYGYENITNKDDWKVKDKLDEAQRAVDNNAANAIALFDVLLQTHPNSPRCWFGKAQALDKLAEERKSNQLLQRSINSYLQVLKLDDVPDALFIRAAERCINRMRFIGDHSRAIGVHDSLIDRFPDEAKYRNQLAVSYLTVNQVEKARAILKETLSKHPDDGFSSVHYGFILKTSDDNLEEAVKYLRHGLATKDEGVLDGRFYFHLGDALARLGKVDEAMEVYEEGVAYNLFLSRYQRSLYNVDRLKGKPWWFENEIPSYKNLFDSLESNWVRIRDEGLSVLSESGVFQKESENLRDTGDWKQFELFARGRKNTENCKKCPFTCEIIEKFPEARNCKRGQTKFSVMHPGTHVWPHCGPTNCRLRVHLGLNVPPKTFIRVADEIRSWENGKVLIFDDSFEHEVWHNGSTFRLILIVDVWHPELTRTEKNSLSPI